MKYTMVQARAMAEMKQAEVAEKMGVTAAALSQWETGKARMSDEWFTLFCQVVGIDKGKVKMPQSLN